MLVWLHMLVCLFILLIGVVGTSSELDIVRDRTLDCDLLGRTYEPTALVAWTALGNLPNAQLCFIGQLDSLEYLHRCLGWKILSTQSCLDQCDLCVVQQQLTAVQLKMFSAATNYVWFRHPALENDESAHGVAVALANRSLDEVPTTRLQFFPDFKAESISLWLGAASRWHTVHLSHTSLGLVNFRAVSWAGSSSQLELLDYVRAPTTRYELSAVTIARNEGPYVEEWLRVHLVVGVQHFFIYDDESNDDFAERLAPYVQLGVVTLIQLDRVEGRRSSMQEYAFAHFIVHYAHLNDWYAVIDLDEFVYPHARHCSAAGTTPVLRRILASLHDDVQEVRCPWKTFGSNGLVDRPMFTTTAYTRRQTLQRRHVRETGHCAKEYWGRMGKSFHRGLSCRILNPHHCALPSLAANRENYAEDAVLHRFTDIKLNHYASRTLVEYLQKKTDAAWDTIANRGRPRQAAEWEHRDCNDEEDFDIQCWAQVALATWSLEPGQFFSFISESILDQPTVIVPVSASSELPASH